MLNGVLFFSFIKPIDIVGRTFLNLLEGKENSFLTYFRLLLINEISLSFIK